MRENEQFLKNDFLRVLRRLCRSRLGFFHRHNLIFAHALAGEENPPGDDEGQHADELRTVQRPDLESQPRQHAWDCLARY